MINEPITREAAGDALIDYVVFTRDHGIGQARRFMEQHQVLCGYAGEPDDQEGLIGYICEKVAEKDRQTVRGDLVAVFNASSEDETVGPRAMPWKN